MFEQVNIRPKTVIYDRIPQPEVSIEKQIIGEMYNKEPDYLCKIAMIYMKPNDVDMIEY